MLNYKQLYQHNKFELPTIETVDLSPFPQHQIQVCPDPNRDAYKQRLFKPKPDQIINHCVAYSLEFQQLCAKENIYPFMLAVGQTKICVVCKDCLMLCEWWNNESGKFLQGGDELIRFGKWEKIKMSQTPTAVRVGRHSLFVGFQSGKISQYAYRTRGWQGSSQQLQFPVLQIDVISQYQHKQSTVVALDSAGNIIMLTFSHKTFLDKIVKTMTSVRWISFMFRNKKREKIKRMFKNLLASKEKDHDTQSSSNQTMELPAPYTYNRFFITSIQQDILMVVYRKHCLQLLIMDHSYQVKSTIPIQTQQEQKELVTVWVSIGQGGFQNANVRHHVLVVGIGCKLAYYRLLTADEDYEVVKVSEIQLKEPLLYGAFISNNLLIVGDSNQVYLANVGQHPQPLFSLSTHKFSYIDFFIDQEGLQVDKNLFMGNLLDLFGEATQGNTSFVALEGKRLIIGTVMGWESMLLSLVCESKWQEAIAVFEAIYSSKFKLCCKINQNMADRNKQMSTVCEAITKGYLQKHISFFREKKEESDAQPSCQLNNLIYFLLKCDYSVLLFSEAQRLLSPQHLNTFFIQQLGPYVQQTNGYQLRIPFISQKYLNLLIEKYKQKGQDYILERLIMQLDLGQMERLLLLGICLREELYRSLISICCEQKDYITPIVKLCGIGLSMPIKRQRTSDITYWYLRECLEGRMTDYGNEADYLNMLAILINFVFIPSSLEMLLVANHIYLMRIIYMFFDPKVMRFILENQTRFFMRKDQDDQPLFENNCLSQFKLYERMLSVLISVVENSPEPQRNGYDQELYRLLLTLMLRNQLPFLSRIKLDIIRYFINHPLLFVGGDELSEDKEVEVNGQLMRLLDSLVRSINDKCLSLREKSDNLKVVTEIEDLLKSEKQKEMNTILDLIMISPFSQQLSETKCYIHHQLGHFSTVLELYLRMLNKKVRTKIFMYLENNLNQFSELTLQFLKYLLSLLGIDQQKTVHLLWNLREGWVDHEEVIDKLVDYPSIQLGYLERAMKTSKDKSKKLLLRHLEIVLREHGNQIQQFISKIDYPLEEAFRMCQEHNNRMGKACILIKSGRNMEGVMIMSEIFLESVRQYLPVLKKSGQVDEEREIKIMGQLQAVLATCRKEWLIDNDRGEQIWQKNTEVMFKKLAVNNIDTPHVPDIIRTFLNKIITAVLSTMLQEVSTDFFLNRFVKTFSSLPQRLFLQAYTYIYNRLEFTFTLEKLNKDILQAYELDLWHHLMATIYRAHICQIFCHSCNHAVTTNQKMVSFSCQHVMHEQCYLQQDIKKNKNELCPLCFNPLQSFLMCGEDRPLKYRLEVDETELLKAKMVKMNYYDRTTQIAAMEQWAKFEQWVDL